jgi:translation initiation factor 4B
MKPLPTEAPFIAYVGNLGYDVVEDDLEKTFAQLQIKSVKLVRDRETQRSKGFGYIEFESVVDLEEALKFTGESLQGRQLKMDVAEPPRDRPERSSFASRSSDRPPRPGRDEPEVPQGNWRRDAPLPPRRIERRPSSRERPQSQRSWQDRPPRPEGGRRESEKPSAPKANPFGAAKPVADKQQEVLQRIEAKLAAEKQKLAEEVAKDAPPAAATGAPGRGGDRSRGSSRPSSGRPSVQRGESGAAANAKPHPADQPGAWQKVEKKSPVKQEKKAPVA